MKSQETKVNDLAGVIVDTCLRDAIAKRISPDLMISAACQAILRIAAGAAYSDDARVSEEERDEIIAELPRLAACRVAQAIKNWDFPAFMRFRAKQAALRN